MSNKNVNQTEPKKLSGSFFQDNQKSITFIVGGIILLILLYLGYQRLYLAPRAEKAANQLYKAEEYDAFDSPQANAIECDGSILGCKEIAEEYYNTKSDNIANEYLGGLYLRKVNFQEAITYLQKYSDTGSEISHPLVTVLIGDA